jgi:hypothetical protein
MIIARQSTARTVTVGPVLDADGVAVTDGVVADFKISKNGGAPAALNGSATLTHRNTGHYSLALTASDHDTAGPAQVVIDDTVNACAPLNLFVMTAAAFDAQYGSSAPGYVANAPVNVAQIGGDAQSATDLKDFADAGYDPATNKVQGVVLTDTVTTYTGNTPQTGDAFARLGAPAGASVSADIAAIEAQTDDIGAAGAGLTAVPWNAAWDAEVQSEVEDALVAHRLDELLNADSDIDGAAPPTVGSVFHELMTKTAASFTYDQTTDSLEALRDNTGTAGAGLTAIDLPDQTMNITGNISGSVGSVTGAVGSVTGNVGGNVTGSVGSVATGGIAAASFAAGAIDAAAIAANAIGASELAADAVAEIADAVWDEAQSGHTTAGTFGKYLDTEVSGVGGGSAPTAAEVADAVWDEAIAGHLSAGSTGAKLNSAASAGDPWSTSLPGSYASGEAGNILGNLLDSLEGMEQSLQAAFDGDTMTIFKGAEYSTANGNTQNFSFPSLPDMTGGDFRYRVLNESKTAQLIDHQLSFTNPTTTKNVVWACPATKTSAVTPPTPYVGQIVYKTASATAYAVATEFPVKTRAM